MLTLVVVTCVFSAWVITLCLLAYLHSQWVKENSQLNQIIELNECYIKDVERELDDAKYQVLVLRRVNVEIILGHLSEDIDIKEFRRPHLN